LLAASPVFHSKEKLKTLKRCNLQFFMLLYKQNFFMEQEGFPPTDYIDKNKEYQKYVQNGVKSQKKKIFKTNFLPFRHEDSTLSLCYMDNESKLRFKCSPAVLNTWIFIIKKPLILLLPNAPTHDDNDLHVNGLLI
jgi:hypothetical protein